VPAISDDDQVDIGFFGEVENCKVGWMEFSVH
jgi:hypothetical protein